MAVTDLLAQYGVDAGDRVAVYELLRRLPLAARSRVELWEEYARGRGFAVSSDERRELSA